MRLFSAENRAVAEHIFWAAQQQPSHVPCYMHDYSSLSVPLHGALPFHPAHHAVSVLHASPASGSSSAYPIRPVLRKRHLVVGN